MKRLSLIVFGVAAGLACLALGASAARTSASGVKVIRLNAPLEALAMSGDRVAYDVKGIYPKPNRVRVWNLTYGTTMTVSGSGTAGVDGTVAGRVSQLAIAGTQVTWLVQSIGMSHEFDGLFFSWLPKPKEQEVVYETRSSSETSACGTDRYSGQACVGPWLGGVVASGNRTLVNRWTTDASGAITSGGLYTLTGTRFGPLATATKAVEAVAADASRVAVLQWRWNQPATTIRVFSSTGTSLFAITPAGTPLAVALSGRNLVVLEPKGKLALYDGSSGSLRKTFNLPASATPKTLAVYNNIVVYADGGTIHALNVANGKDRPVGHLPAQITLARINATGLVYTNNLWTEAHGYQVQLVFVPFKQVAAAVS